MNAKTLAQHMPAQALADTIQHIWENCGPSYDSVDAAMICILALVDLVGIDEANKLIWDSVTAHEEVS